MKLKVSLAQIKVANAQPQKNLQKAEEYISEAAKRNSELICFPEMFLTGFNWKFLDADKNNFETYIDALSSLAKKYKIWINGSVPELTSNGKITNTSVLFSSDGSLAGRYSKIHLFSLLKENKHLSPGNEIKIIDTSWGKAGMSICYDLRFPELFRTCALRGAKIQLLPSAWPYPRLEHYKILIKARAIENQNFIIAVNQVGDEKFSDDNTVTYFGSSVIVDPWGNIVIEASEKEETLLTAEIDLDVIDEVRKKITVFSDRKPELYNPD